MRKMTVVAMAVVVIMACAGSAFAANSLANGNFGLSVGFTDLSAFPDGLENTIIGKLFLSNDLAAVLGFGLTSASGDAGMADGTDLSLLIGVRKYLKNDDFAPFAEGLLVYINNETDAAAAGSERETIGVLANFGGEYFLHKQFSLEGSAGIGLMKIEDTIAGISADTTVLGTTSVGVRANFYF